MRTSLHLLTGLLLVALAHASDSLALAAADDDNAHDFLKLAGSPSPQSDPSQRTRAIQLPVLQKRSSAGYGCGMGHEQCPGINACCQAGLSCFTDGTCGNGLEMVCDASETQCGNGTKAGCCPRKTSCVRTGVCMVSSGEVKRRWEGHRSTVVTGVGLVAGVAVVLVGFV